MAAAGDKLEASGGERLVTLLGGRPIQEPLPVVRSQTPAEHRTSGAPSGELAYFQLTPADTPRSYWKESPTWPLLEISWRHQEENDW